MMEELDDESEPRLNEVAVVTDVRNFSGPLPLSSDVQLDSD